MERLGRSGDGSAGGGSGGMGFADIEGFRVRIVWGGEVRDDATLVETDVWRFSVSVVPRLSTLT
jgi:hypothetical protein